MEKPPLQERTEPDYETRYKKADEFSRTSPTLEEALEFGRKKEIGFSNSVDEESNEVSYGNSADAEGILMAMVGEKGFDRAFRQLKEIMGTDEVSVIDVKEKDGHLTIKARAQYEDWSDETDDEGNAWRVTEIEYTEETLRGKSGRFKKD